MHDERNINPLREDEITMHIIANNELRDKVVGFVRRLNDLGVLKIFMDGDELDKLNEVLRSQNILSGQYASINYTGANLLRNYESHFCRQVARQVAFVKVYDENEIADKLFLGTSENSILGDKSDSLLQSTGQVLTTAGLQALGVPFYVTTGATSFGSAAENALNDGASYGEAGVSAAITSAAEILTEKLGGISFGNKTVTDALSGSLTQKISNDFVQKIADFGLSSVLLGEGTEESPYIVN